MIVLALCVLVAWGAETRVQVANEAGEVYAALGAGARGDPVKMAIAQLMRGRGAALLLQSVRDNVEKELDEVYNVTEDLPLPPPRKLTTLGMPPTRAIMDHLLEFAVPKINCTQAAIRNITAAILDWEMRLRASVDEIQAAVGARELQVRQRHVIQMEQLLATEAAAQLMDATGPKKDFDRTRRSHLRQFRQISRTLRRLHRGEIQALRIAGRLFRQLQIAKAAIAEDRISRFVAKLMDVFNENGKGARELVKWANDILADGYILELEESRLMAASGAMMGAIAVTTEESMTEMLIDLLKIDRTSEIALALALATSRRNARVFTHRAIVELKTLFSYNLVVEEALKIVRISADEAHKMFRTEQGIIEGRLDNESFWGSNSSDYDLAEQIKRNPRHTKLDYPRRFFIKAKEGFERIREQVEREFDKNGFLFERHNETQHLEARIHVTKPMVRQTRALADDIEHLAEGEAAYLLAQEHLARDNDENKDREKALAAFAIAQRALERFISDEPKHFHSGFPMKDNLDDYKDPPTEAELREKYLALLEESRKNQTKFLTWGKYGHRPSLRGRIYRQGVAVDRKVMLPPDAATRAHLDRLERAMRKETIYWSVASRRRQAGEAEGELRLAERIGRHQGALRVPAFPREELKDRNGVNMFAHYADPLIGMGITGVLSTKLRGIIRMAQYLRKFQPVALKDAHTAMNKAVHKLLKQERDLMWQAGASVHDARKFVNELDKRYKWIKRYGKKAYDKKKEEMELTNKYKGKAHEIFGMTEDIMRHHLIGNVDETTESLLEILMGVKAAGHEGVEAAARGLRNMAKKVQGRLGKEMVHISHQILNGTFVSINSRADRKPKPEDLYSDNRMRNLENFFYEAVPRIQIDFPDAKKTINRTVLDIEEYFENFPLDVRLPDEPDVKFEKFPF